MIGILNNIDIIIDSTNKQIPFNQKCIYFKIKENYYYYFLKFQVLPSWNNTLGGSLSFKFRTNEETGLLLFNPGMAPGSVSLILKLNYFYVKCYLAVVIVKQKKKQCFKSLNKLKTSSISWRCILNKNGA